MSKRNSILFLSIALSMLLLFGLELLLGSVNISPGEVWQALTSGNDDHAMRSIVMQFRLPKALVALLAGAALGASGLQMQTLFRNPLAGPYVLGISSGASLGVAIFLLGAPLIGAWNGLEIVRNLGIAGAAWLGAALIFLLIMAVSRRIKDIMVILILGMMFGSAAGALVEILQYFSPEGAVKSFVVWTMGSLGGVTVPQLRIMMPVILIGLLLAILAIKPLNALLLGENYARTLGVHIGRARATILISTTLLAGTVTAFCGPIGFLGLAVPHIARIVFSEADHRTLMPASILLGATLMLACDLIAQMPGQRFTLPINTITALVGIPVIVVVIIRNRKIF